MGLSKCEDGLAREVFPVASSREPLLPAPKAGSFTVASRHTL
jgi:hypothetical protein